MVKFNLKSSRKEWVRRIDGCANPSLCEIVEGGRIVVVFSEKAVLLRHVSLRRRFSIAVATLRCVPAAISAPAP